jgi:hypothetical protein
MRANPVEGYRTAFHARDVGQLVALAAAVTLLNAFKPFTPDDAYHHHYANHFAKQPFDPYGFLLWEERPAHTALGPPVFLYWWAIAIRLFGDDPFFCRLSLFPILLLLAFSLHAIGRRFAAGREMLFVAFVMPSGAVLPLVNMLLDVPAPALALTALVLFFRACDRDSTRLSIAAGVVAALAMQTKYTAFVAPALMLLYSWHKQSLRLGVLSAATSAALFVGWECFIAMKYGASHFLAAAAERKPTVRDKLHLMTPMFGCLGAMLSLALPFALAALGRSKRLVLAAAGAGPAIFALAAWLPGSTALRDGLAGAQAAKTIGLLFGLLGLALVGAIISIAYRMHADGRSSRVSDQPRFLITCDEFLIGWLALELLGYFAISPFPASRRLIGVCIVSVLLISRLAARAAVLRPKLLWSLAAANALHGLLLFAVDFNYYFGQEKLIALGIERSRRESPDGRVWIFGHPSYGEWNLEFYASRFNVKQLHEERALSPGDMVLVAQPVERSFRSSSLAKRCEAVGSVELRSITRLKSKLQAGNVPVVPWDDPCFRVTYHRVMPPKDGESAGATPHDPVSVSTKAALSDTRR